MSVIRLFAVALVLALSALLFLAGCREREGSTSGVHDGSTGKVRTFRVGYSANPLLGPLYAADKAEPRWELVRFGSGGDIGYALIAGEIDAGFVETEKALELLKAPGGEKLKIAGAVQFPYGATLIVRKDLKLRLADLAGKHLAALEPDCILNHQFNTDARRLGLDPKKIRYSYMPFDQMLPALESRAIDGALVKGAYAVLAELQGHKVIYQNWDIKAGADECCPPSIAQTEYFLVVRDQALDEVTPLIKALTAASELSPSEIRRAVSNKLGYPKEALEQFPVATFAPVSEEQRKLLGDTRCLIVH
jgi:ABC-type nitrate/sulfonate/bicarbonate transport system substrate-binding protein